MAESNQDKTSDRVNDSTAKQTGESTKRDATITTREQLEKLQAAYKSNPDNIPNNVSVNDHLAALRPGMSPHEADEAQARLDAQRPKTSLAIDMGNGETITAADFGKAQKNADGSHPSDKNTSAESESQSPEVNALKNLLSSDSAPHRQNLVAENLDSATMKSLEKAGPEAVRHMMQNINAMRDALKGSMPQNEIRDQFDLDLKRSALDSLPSDVKAKISMSLISNPKSMTETNSVVETQSSTEKQSTPEDHSISKVHSSLDKTATLDKQSTLDKHKTPANYSAPDKHSVSEKDKVFNETSVTRKNATEDKHAERSRADREPATETHLTPDKIKSHSDHSYELEIKHRPLAENPSGTLVFKDKTGYHQMRCVDGKVLDSNQKPIGQLTEDGILKIDGKSFKINSTDNHNDYTFIGNSGTGEGLRFVAPKDVTALSGALTSFDGKTNYLVVAGNIFDNNGNFKGHLDEHGHVELIRAGNSSGSDADLNVLFNRMKFEGIEKGEHRFFITNNDMSNGTLMVPAKELPTHKGNAQEMVKLQVREGMLIDQQGKQVGVLFAPNTDTGHLVGGSVIWSGGKTVIPLSDLKNASFDLKVLGEGGHAGRSLKGVCLGSEKSKGGGLFDVQAAVDVSDAHLTDKVSKLEDYQHQGLGIFKWSVDQLSGTHERDKSVEIKNESRLKSDLNSLVKTGVTDTAKLSELLAKVQNEKRDLDPHSKAPSHSDGKPDQQTNANDKLSNKAEGTRSHKSAPEKQIGVPKLDNQSVAKVDGQLIMDGSAYQIRKGNLHLIHDDGHGHGLPDSKPSGQLLADYKVKLDGNQGAIDLARENRVLLKFSIDGEKLSHRVLGMGRTRVTADGTTVNGGLVSVDEISQKIKGAAQVEVKANQDYFKGKDVMTHLTTGLMGGSADSGLADSAERYQQMTKLFDKVCNKLFDVRTASGEVNTKQIDKHVATVQTVMNTFNLEVASDQQTRGELKQSQSTLNEAATMALITVGTMGVGTYVASVANAGKFATMGRFAHMGSIAARVGGGAAVGGAIRAVGSYHEGQSSAEIGGNFAGGCGEGAVMSAFNFTSSFQQARKLSQGLALSRGVEEAAVAGKVVPKAIAQIDQIAEAGGIKQTEAWLLKSGLGRTAGSLTESQANAAKIGLNFTDNVSQSAGFGVSNYFRTANNPEVPHSGPFNATEVALGTTTGMLGHGLSGILGRENATFKQINEWLPPELHFKANDAIEHMITQTPQAAISNFGVGVCNAIPTEFDRARQKLADQTGMDINKIGIDDIVRYDRLGDVMNSVAQSAGLNALISSPLTVAHGFVEQKIGIHTKEYLGPSELGKSKSDSLFKPVKDKLAEQVAESMLNKPGSRIEEIGKKVLGWAPSTVSTVERYNKIREQLTALPESLQGDVLTLIGKIGSKGVDNAARLRIVENLFTISDTKTTTGLAEMKRITESMVQCMRPAAEDGTARPAVPKLEQVFDQEQVALIRAMDAAQARIAPAKITREQHEAYVDEGYERAKSKAPGGFPAQERIIHLVVGPPGAGKSSSLVDPFKNRDRCMEIDSDDIKPTIDGYSAKFRGMDHVGFGAGSVHPVSSKIAEDILARAMDNGDNIIHPILGRTPEGVLDLVMTAKAKGYNVAIHLADVPPEISAGRAFDRGQKPVEDGKRQMVPASYSLDVVKWGPQITFDRLTERMQHVIDELNYCNTNLSKNEKPVIEQKSQSQLREGVEFFKRLSGKEKTGEGGGDWPKFNSKRSSDIVQQSDRTSCVSACGEMLTEGKIDQSFIISKIDSPADTLDLLKVLDNSWNGHGFTEAGIRWLLNTSDQPFVTELVERYDGVPVRGLAHAIVVDGLTAQGNVMIRDPWDGSRYEMTKEKFVFHCTGKVVYRRSNLIK